MWGSWERVKVSDSPIDLSSCDVVDQHHLQEKTRSYTRVVMADTKTGKRSEVAMLQEREREM